MARATTKKEIKNAYKQMKFRIGIFQIKNRKTNRKYLSTSTDLERAYNSDRFQLQCGLHRNKDLQRDWNTFGSDEFEFGIVDELKVEDSATETKIKSDLNDFIEMYKMELLKTGEQLYE
ncbi:MAG: GIY-YIG nuclease family protein [Dysgonamonadaceae bacterium]|jgi:hypothetical protein|nr:GIY-YIG nuclease family protein [Dysgonamonadaceae bacterium]